MRSHNKKKITSLVMSLFMIFSLFTPLNVHALEKTGDTDSKAISSIKTPSISDTNIQEKSSDEKIKNDVKEDEVKKQEKKEVKAESQSKLKKELEEKQVKENKKLQQNISQNKSNKDLKEEKKAVTKNTLAASNEKVKLQILATSDTHGRFVPYNYAINEVDNSGSLAQLSTAIKKFRGENPNNTIVVDNGDIIQDNSQNLFLTKDNPMIKAMNYIGYDTITLGNHEFNNGITKLKDILGQANATVLCGNVYNPDGSRLYSPYKIVTTKEGVKVGIIGMTTPNIVKWDSDNLKGYKVTNPVEETKKVISEIKDKVDVMIAVDHMGVDGEYGAEGSGAKELANACPELSVIIAGHAHSSIKGERVNGTLIVEPGRFAQQLGKVDIELTKRNGKYVVENKANDVTTDLVYISGKHGEPVYYEADTQLLNILKPYDEKAKNHANEKVGKLVSGDLVKADEVKGIPTSQVQPSAMIELINKVQMYYGEKFSKDKKPVDVSAAAAFNSNANIKEGVIKRADISLIYKHDNSLWLLEVTGKQLKQYMEWSANYYNTYKSGDLTVSFNPNVRGYNYDMFSGVKYDIDISKEPGNRIVNLTKMDGTPIKDTDVLRLAVNNYRGSTQLTSYGTVFKKGDKLPKIIFKSEDTLQDAGRIRDLIRNYIVDVKGGTIKPECDNNWKITGTNWNKKDRALAVKLINEGKLEIPKSFDGRTPNVRSITLDDIEKVLYKVIDIVTFNDLHGAVENSGKNSGIAKLAGEIKKYKESNPNTIVVSGGDNFQGSAISNLTYGKVVNEMFKEVGVTASAIGNHEFDWGTSKIPNWAKEGGYDFLASNIYDTKTNKPVQWAKPYKIVTVSGVKIGFVGLATPSTAWQTKAENVAGIEFRDPIEYAKIWTEKLKNGTLPEGKADVVIALTHLGSMQDYDNKVITGEAADLCKANVGVDAVISAHTHQGVSGTVNGIPLIQAYKQGRDLGKLRIVMNADGTVKEIKPVLDVLYKRADTLESDPAVEAICTKYIKDLQPILSEVVGVTDTELSHDRHTSAGTSPLGKWTCDVMRKKANVQIGITNGGGLRCPIPKGNITMGKLYEVMPFDNTLVTMKLKGSDLKRVIEHGIMNEEIGWVQVSGLKAYYDKNAKAGSRITAMILDDGTAVDMNKYYSVVVNDFMAPEGTVGVGGDGFDFTGVKDLVNTQIPIRDALVEELKALNGKHLVVNDSKTLVAGKAPATDADKDNTDSKIDNEKNNNHGTSSSINTGKTTKNTTTSPAAKSATNSSNTSLNKLPQTGSMVDTTSLVTVGVLAILLGFALYVRNKEENEEENVA